MKKIIFIILTLAFSINFYGQSMLCTYEGGYFIRSGNSWYEYKPHKYDGVWEKYTQYSQSENYYYINSDTKIKKLRIPKSSSRDIDKKGKGGSWSFYYTTINVYNYCPIRSSRIFTYKNGFYIKKGTDWTLYKPSKKNNGAWASYTEYNKDAKYYYIKSSKNKIAIPRDASKGFYIWKDGEWDKFRTPEALYDPDSPNAKSGEEDGSNEDIAFEDYSSILSSLPITRTFQSALGSFECTLNSDGSITSTMKNYCTVCSQTGICRVCAGTGTQYRAGGIYPCGYCGGSTRCKRCQGKGYTVQNSASQYGHTVIVDEEGNLYFDVVGVGSAESQMSNSSRREKRERKFIEKTEYIPGFGLDPVYCPKCGRTGERHIHVKKYY